MITSIFHKMNTVDIIVTGAGHAGVSISYHLKQAGISHLVFEKGKIGETWSSQRWDSFKLNTPNKSNLLPGMETFDGNADGFATADEFINYLRTFVNNHQLPVKENSKVISIEKHKDVFIAEVIQNGISSIYQCRQVVIASGAQNEIQVPGFAKNIDSSILQLHAASYKNPLQLPKGNVLVVGSGQSGTQITEDLISTDKKIFFSTSKVGRVPRRYRGKDIIDWLFGMGQYDIRTEEVKDHSVLRTRTPQLSGVGLMGKTTSLQSLAKNGVTILGKAANADAGSMYFQLNAAEHIQFADEVSLSTKNLIDKYIEQHQLPAPDAVTDADDLPDENASCAANISELNFKEHNITTIIWTTGFGADYSYLKLPVIDKENSPIHKNGISPVKGLYFLGMPWLISKKSGIVLGIKEDAKFIAEQIITVRQQQ